MYVVSRVYEILGNAGCKMSQAAISIRLPDVLNTSKLAFIIVHVVLR